MAVAQPPSSTEEITWEQYLKEFSAKPPTMQPYEIIDGVRHIMNAPLLIHQIVQLNIAERFRQYQRHSGRGIVVVSPFDVVIRRRPRLKTRQPDVMFISREQLEKAGGIHMEGPLEVAPELVVEIISPSETPRTLRSKIEDFRSIGTQECWTVSPNAENVQVLRLTEEGSETVAVYAYGQTVQSLAFPDLTMAVADMFEA